MRVLAKVIEGKVSVGLKDDRCIRLRRMGYDWILSRAENDRGVGCERKDTPILAGVF